MQSNAQLSSADYQIIIKIITSKYALVMNLVNNLDSPDIYKYMKDYYEEIMHYTDLPATLLPIDIEKREKEYITPVLKYFSISSWVYQLFIITRCNY